MKNMRILIAQLASLTSFLMATTNISAQDISSEATYGAIELAGNFQPDPFVIDLSAGGNIDASDIDGCVGYISNAPDFKLSYTKTSTYDLGIFVISDADTTIVINTPGRDWYCNDDFDETDGINPGVMFSNPATGIYDIWVGTFDKGDSYPAAQLVITELGAPWNSTQPPAEERPASIDIYNWDCVNERGVRTQYFRQGQGEPFRYILHVPGNNPPQFAGTMMIIYEDDKYFVLREDQNQEVILLKNGEAGMQTIFGIEVKMSCTQR